MFGRGMDGDLPAAVDPEHEDFRHLKRLNAGCDM
jgi:hypothetical protein